ncbi:unnamed protein product [Euphydryas editha]|uniref:Reverse transcriptase n=1 Tax=Euphydryas editha TaxID=104508 RepID=A0AAU9V6S0_EUPED|nr:unnamed protein product [Euphydryas editha]
MVVTHKRKFDTPRLHMGGVDIGMSQQIKLLGVVIPQASASSAGKLGRHLEVIRHIYRTVVEPIILYAASVWVPTVHILGIRKRLNVVLRGFAQKLYMAYRTVSLNSTLLLAGMLPLDLRACEVAALYGARRGVSQREMGDRGIERMTSALL